MSSAVALPPGTEVGGLLIQRVLGRGGFGIVYEAHDPDLDRKVALKEYFLSNYARREGAAVLPTDAAMSEFLEQGKARFLREARLLAMLQERAHAHTGSLVVVHRVLQANQTAYMVMKLYQGPTFGARVRQNPGAVTQGWLTPLLLRVLDALEVLHSLPNENLVHRDVSPDNIIVQPDDTPVLLDFGATRSIDADLTSVIVKEGYSPIEQYTDLHPHGPWTDLYALCGTAYYAICGLAPGYAVDRLAGRPFVSAAERGAGRFDEAFLAVLDRGLAVLPKDRFQSVAEMRRGLDQAGVRPSENNGAGLATGVFLPGGSWTSTRAMPAAAAKPADTVDSDATSVRPLSQPGWGSDVPTPLCSSAAWPAGPPPPPILPLPQTSSGASASSPARNRIASPAIMAGGAALLLGLVGLGGFGLWRMNQASPPAAVQAAVPAAVEAPSPVPRPPVAGTVPGLSCTAEQASWPCVVEGLARVAPASQGQTFAITPSSAAVGERMNLSFVSPKEGYLYVFTVDEPAGSAMALLFPRADDLKNRVQANVPLKLPRRPIWDIVVSPPSGRSWLLAVVTSEPVPGWAPSNFKPVTLAKAMAEFQSRAPWQAFGIEACAPGTACFAPQAVLPAEFMVR